jgi:sn-glycerol 3-phosphate transport system substrate-binding protein
LPILKRNFVLAIGVLLASGCGVPEDADGRVSITYWRTLTGGAGDAQHELAERFNAAQDAVSVSVEFQGGYGDLAAKLMTAAAGGTGPDVTQLGTYEIREFARNGLLADLTEFVNGPNGLDTSDWPGTMLDAGRVEGGLYWLPFNVTVPVLYYNADAFADAGLDAPPETWSEFFSYVTLLTKRNDDGVVTRHGLALWDETWPLLSMIWSAGGEITNADYSNITFDDPATVVIFERLQALVRDGAIDIPAKASGGHRAAFTSGRAAMILDSPAPFDELFQQAASFTPEVANYPAGAEGRVYAPGGGGIAMLARVPAEEREAAWAFMRYLLQPEQLAYYAERSGYCAFTGSSQRVGETWLADPHRKTIHAALPNLRGDFSVNMSPTIRNLLQNAFGRILIRLEDPETVLREVDAAAEASIQSELAVR